MSPADHYQDLRSEMVLNLESVGVKIEVHHHEVASAGQTEIDMRFDTLLKMADRVLWYKYVHQEHGQEARQDRDLHAQADLPGQRLGHAHPPVAVEGRQEPLLREGRLRRHLRDVQALHRRHPEARPGAAGLHRPVHQQLPPPGAGLRGAHQPGLQRAQPLGGRPHPDVLELARRPSGSSSAPRTRPATPTCRSRPA